MLKKPLPIVFMKISCIYLLPTYVGQAKGCTDIKSTLVELAAKPHCMASLLLTYWTGH